MSKSHDRFIADTNTDYLMSRIAELGAQLKYVNKRLGVSERSIENYMLNASYWEDCHARLAEAVEQIRDRHLIPLANQEGQDLLRMDLNDLDDALERKEQHNETKKTTAKKEAGDA